ETFDAPRRATAWAELVETALESERTPDASYYLGQLRRERGDLALTRGQTVADRVSALQPKVAPNDQIPPWTFDRVEDTGGRSFRPDPNKRLAFAIDPSLPFFAGWQIVFDGQRWELEFLNRATGSLDWKLTRLPASLAYQQPLNFHQVGQLMLFEQ